MPSERISSPRNFIVKFKNRRSANSLKEVMRFLQTTRGVDSVMVDQDGETAAISGTVGPTKIVKLLRQGLGLKAFLLWEDSPGLPFMDARDIFKKFALKLDDIETSNVRLKLKDGHDQSSVEINLKSVGGVFGASSSCCGCFTVALVHVPVNRRISCGFGNHSNNLHVTPPPPPTRLSPPWYGGYAPSAPPMENANDCYHGVAPPPPPPAPAMGGSFQYDDEDYFDAPPPPAPDHDMDMCDSFSYQDDEY